MAYLFRVLLSKQLFSLPLPRLVHTSAQLKQIMSNDDNLISSIINCLHKGVEWRTLTQKFKSVELTDYLVQRVLLQLIEPANSKKALCLFHWSAKDMRLQHEIPTYCMTIHILVKGRLIKDAKALLETALTKHSTRDNAQVISVLNSLLSSYEVVDSTPFVFDLFIRTCAKLRMLDDILGACKLLFDRGFELNMISFNALLHVMQKSENPHLTWGVYHHMIDIRMYPNEVTTKIMVSVLCKEGKLEKFLGIVDNIHGKRCSVSGIVVNTCLVYEIIEADRTEDGCVLMKRMLQKNMLFDTISYSLFVFAKLKRGDIDAAKEVYLEMLNRGFRKNAFVCSLFIGAYCDVNRIIEAIMLYEEMELLGFKPTAETLSLLMECCSRNGRSDDSLTFCKNMLAMGLVPSCSAVNEMIGKLCESGNAKEADEVLTMLLDKGFIADEITFSCLICGYCREDQIEKVMKILFEMEYRSLSLNMLGFTSFIVTLSKLGSLKEADKHLKMMKAQSFDPDEHVYMELIAGHLRNGDKVRARELYGEMIGTLSNTDLACLESLVQSSILRN